MKRIKKDDEVIVIASREDDTLTARSVMRFGGAFARDFVPRMRASVPTQALAAF